ncbi:hypothetical protein DMENIID0001_105940 [Sergentomyia squamirostris]
MLASEKFRKSSPYKMAIFAAFLILTTNFNLAEVSRFDNYHVYQVQLNSLNDVNLIKSMEDDFTSGFEVLSPVKRKFPQDVNVLVPPHALTDFTSVLDSSTVTYGLVEKNFQDVINQEARMSNLKLINDGYGWDRYYRLENMHRWMRSLPEEYPGVVTNVIAGNSYENRELLGLKISHKPGNPAIFFEGGIHAREWISPATTTFIANELLTNNDPEVRRLSETYDWYFFPSVNPDGYVHSTNVNRMWRKTRQPYGICFGADPNRNWDHHWMEVGASSNPCSQVFAGSSAFSEVETLGLSNFIASVQDLRLYVSLHSYSQMLLYPFGTSDKVEKTEDYDAISNATVEAIAKRYGTSYIYGNIEETIYPAAGGSIDWTHGVSKVPMAFTFELRPSRDSFFGFMLPPNEIVPTGEETFDGVTAMVQEAERRGYMDRNDA